MWENMDLEQEHHAAVAKAQMVLRVNDQEEPVGAAAGLSRPATDQSSGSTAGNVAAHSLASEIMGRASSAPAPAIDQRGAHQLADDHFLAMHRRRPSKGRHCRAKSSLVCSRWRWCLLQTEEEQEEELVLRLK